MISFDLYLTNDDKHYNEETFKELVKEYHNNELLDNSITLTSITLELGYDDYTNNDVTNIDNIKTIEELQQLLEVLKNIDRLGKHDRLTLGSIFEVMNYSMDSTVIDCYDMLDDYELWEDKTINDVALDLIDDGYFGDDVSTFYHKHPDYLNVDAITDELYDNDNFIDTGYGVLEYVAD